MAKEVRGAMPPLFLWALPLPDHNGIIIPTGRDPGNLKQTMKLFTALAALTLIAAPVHATSNAVKAKLQASTDHLRSGEYGLACMASTEAYEEAVKAKFSTKFKKQMK